MIEISRLLARQLRSIFRKLAPRSSAHLAKVSFTTGGNGLRVRLHRTEILAELNEPGEERSADEVVIPLEALADFEGRTDTLVMLEAVNGTNVQVLG